MSTTQPNSPGGVAVTGLCKEYRAAAAERTGTVEVLDRIDLFLENGQSVAITGPSGSGKSTLLHIVGTLDHPSSGTVTFDGVDPFELPEPDLARFRNRRIGFVFQDHHLLPQYPVLDNVLLPTLAREARGTVEDDEERARELLGGVGLADRMDHLPAQLSGGERQRVAIARALINEPGLVLCDEPTGNLDAATAVGVADLLFRLHHQRGNILVVVTHSAQLASRCQRRFELRDGRCIEA